MICQASALCVGYIIHFLNHGSPFCIWKFSLMRALYCGHVFSRCWDRWKNGSTQIVKWGCFSSSNNTKEMELIKGEDTKKNWFKAGEMVRCLLLFQRMQFKDTWCSLPAFLGTHAHLTYTHTNTQTYKGGSVDLKWWGKTCKGLMFKQYFYCELGWITSDLCPCESCFLFSKGNGITVTQKMTLFEAV